MVHSEIYRIVSLTKYLFTFDLLRLKTVDILMHSLDEAESQVRKNESRLSEEDIVPADTTAIQNLKVQLGVRDTLLYKLLLQPANEKGSCCETISLNFDKPLFCVFCISFAVSLQKWQSELVEQEGVFQSLQSEVARAKEAGAQLSRLHPDRSTELERYQERASQITERWSGVKRLYGHPPAALCG